MLEKAYKFTTESCKTIEKLIDDEPVLINHAILPEGDALPEHYSNSNVYLIIVRGILTARLDDQDAHQYPCGQIVNVPYHTKMNISNADGDVLEFFIIKAPNPRNYKAD